MKGLVTLISSLLLAACASTGDAGARSLAGHYYLQGAMEMGSELLLNDDGSFEAVVAYGALDAYAQGTWRQAGDLLVLHREPSNARLVRSDMGLGGLFDELWLRVGSDCLIAEALNGCYAKAPARKPFD
ncbi:hypothetical protein [Stutzerimonas azotifigens]|uniref:hypothetical protein n=1 Tax=Stutzerimonas azotifigens TaxID=291995 RepID=UPI000412123E|nr:hypothetical protein [Stutzerimonas azotifigens]